MAWAIHESLTPPLLLYTADSRVRDHAIGALGRAEAVLFEADATRREYAGYLGPDSGMVWPYGVDFDRLGAAREGFDRDAARRARGIAPDTRLVLCMGTIEPREAQAALVQAFGLVANRHPAAQLVLVGSGGDEAGQAVEDFIAGAAPPGRVRVLPMLEDVGSWYGIADLLVCASDVESLPRTVIEAMWWELPVLATEVFGLPDLVREGRTGWLCAERDVGALADGLDRALGASAAERGRLGRAAREVVVERHAVGPYAARCVELLRRLAGEGAT